VIRRALPRGTSVLTCREFWMLGSPVVKASQKAGLIAAAVLVVCLAVALVWSFVAVILLIV